MRVRRLFVVWASGASAGGRPAYTLSEAALQGLVREILSVSSRLPFEALTSVHEMVVDGDIERRRDRGQRHIGYD